MSLYGAVPKADKVKNTEALVSLTDNSGGTASDTIAVIGATYTQAEVQNAVASLAAKLNALLVELRKNEAIKS